MQPTSQPFPNKEIPSLPPDYAILPLSYPEDTTSYLATLKEIFGNDPSQIYLNSNIKNPATMPLREHMRLARFKNNFEGLTPESEGFDTIHLKLVHLPTGAIAGASIWQLPSSSSSSSTTTKTTTTTAVPSAPPKNPYPLLPANATIPPEDSALSTLGPAIDAAMETIVSSIPQLGPAATRNRKWWYLNTLGIAPAHQGKRLGQYLVHWGIERAVADAVTRPELDIKGVWVSATEAGVKTYENAGFERVKTVRCVYGDEQGGLGMRFDSGDGNGIVGNEEMGGQDYVVLVREF